MEKVDVPETCHFQPGGIEPVRSYREEEFKNARKVAVIDPESADERMMFADPERQRRDEIFYSLLDFRDERVINQRLEYVLGLHAEFREACFACRAAFSSAQKLNEYPSVFAGQLVHGIPQSGEMNEPQAVVPFTEDISVAAGSHLSKRTFQRDGPLWRTGVAQLDTSAESAFVRTVRESVLNLDHAGATCERCRVDRSEPWKPFAVGQSDRFIHGGLADSVGAEQHSESAWKLNFERLRGGGSESFDAKSMQEHWQAVAFGMRWGAASPVVARRSSASSYE
ncbi:hypothetical protein BIU92_10665 [Curtobacterium sp. MCBA15_003]|nr:MULTISPECIES: hypothetical protein [unclassified Curtobacterium]OIH92704.1 hypothetical protein BIU92_10665 [Curtobacterium sp. MCBA15_003]OII33348.1 hypothetical protein BIU94_14725 [Curtobacterium sp. MMLR14_006]